MGSKGGGDSRQGRDEYVCSMLNVGVWVNDSDDG